MNFAGYYKQEGIIEQKNTIIQVGLLNKSNLIIIIFAPRNILLTYVFVSVVECNL